MYCEICGSTATQFVQDLNVRTNHANGLREYTVRAEHWFCNIHARPHEIIESIEAYTVDAPWD